MSSGSDRALLYDNLVAKGREGEYAKILPRVRSVGALSLGVSMLAGGLFHEIWSWNGVYIIFTASKFIGAILVVFLPEFKINKTTQDEAVPAQKEPAEMKDTTEETKQPSNLLLLIKFFKSPKGCGDYYLFLLDMPYLRPLPYLFTSMPRTCSPTKV